MNHTIDHEQYLTSEAEIYLTHIWDALPGGVECGGCGEVNTYEPENVAWTRLTDGSYLISQGVRCGRCGYYRVFSWVQCALMGGTENE